METPVSVATSPTRYRRSSIWRLPSPRAQCKALRYVRVKGHSTSSAEPWSRRGLRALITSRHAGSMQQRACARLLSWHQSERSLSDRGKEGLRASATHNLSGEFGVSGARLAVPLLRLDGETRRSAACIRDWSDAGDTERCLRGLPTLVVAQEFPLPLPSTIDTFLISPRLPAVYFRM